MTEITDKGPGLDIEIVYIGLRPGENPREELISEGEGIVKTEHEKIKVIRAGDGFNGHGDPAAFAIGCSLKSRHSIAPPKLTTPAPSATNPNASSPNTPPATPNVRCKAARKAGRAEVLGTLVTMVTYIWRRKRK